MNDIFGNALQSALKGCKDLSAEVERLKNALQIAANRLEGVAIAVRIHGTNINPEFFISEYEKYAKEARSIVVE